MTLFTLECFIYTAIVRHVISVNIARGYSEKSTLSLFLHKISLNREISRLRCNAVGCFILYNCSIPE